MSLMKILDIDSSFLKVAAHKAFMDELNKHIKDKLASLDDMQGLSCDKHDIEQLIHSVEMQKMKCLKGEISAKRLYRDVDYALSLFKIGHPGFDYLKDPFIVAYYS